LFSFLPANNREEAPLQKTKENTLLIDESLDTFIPKSLHQPYDMKSLIQKTLDESFFFEIGPSFAPNLLTGFGRYQGRSIGIVANQPQVMSGCLDLKACQKAARFIRFCDAFHLPLVSFVDTPGFLPGLEQEQGGILLQAAKLMHAYAEATSPKITLITRKSFSSAYPIMASKGLRSDLCLTYPASEIGQKEFSATAALELGEIDAIILPRETRKKMVQSLEMLKNKVERLLPKKHGNIPL
ncbi:MAG: methylmalonyl-CoA carboxyltransferase, partial [Deltaproteobacteria bacterium]|nr:methylmalonyl-CoA carboxyltransferase [Deltaproteobacteria bacterium]